jgi:hypothetical protein
VATPLALVFDLIARDGASPVFNRVAVSADRAAVATGRAEKSVVGIGGKMKAAFAGLAIGAVGVEVVKSAVQFQKSMLLIQTQAGASAAEVKKMSTAVLSLGPFGGNRRRGAVGVDVPRVLGVEEGAGRTARRCSTR